MVKSSADALLTVINDILDFSKIEAGKLDLEPIDFASARYPRRYAQGARPAGRRRRDSNSLCQFDPDVPDALVGDPVRLRQIVINLVGNAIKFTEHGEVVVEVKNEAPPEEQIRLRISVADTGAGIPVEKQDLIFDAFAQADTSTTRQYGGTGLGLTISSRLVRLDGRKHLGRERGR